MINMLEVAYKTSSKLSKISLNSLMQLYGDNYRKINRLFDIGEINKRSTLRSTISPVIIELEVVDEARYTTTIRANYIFNDTDEQIPNAKIRLYHDTRQAEVLQLQNQYRFNDFFSLTKYSGLSNIEARWILNNFLHKWLGFCLKNKYK